MTRLELASLAVTLGVAASMAFPAAAAHAQTTGGNSAGSTTSTPAVGDFYLQVSPSPLVATLRPGVATELELKIRNAGTSIEQLKIEPRSFKLNDDTGKVTLDDTNAPEVAPWVSFSAPTFTIKPGEWFTQRIKIALPKDAGFSYSFALLVSRKDNPKPIEGGRLIKGSLAVFTLVNVDRPGSTRKLEVDKFSVGKNVYEYLPAEITVSLKNSGNSIVQPYGNIYLQRGAKDAAPISTLPVNDKRSYILPGSVRTLNAQWQDGFPAYKTTTGADGKQTTKLVWDWSKVSNFRIGKYTAKLVAVYNDGAHDIPIEGTASFWVIPWKILAGLAVVGLLLLFSIGSIIWKIARFFRRKRTGKVAKSSAKHADKQSEPKQPSDPPAGT